MVTADSGSSTITLWSDGAVEVITEKHGSRFSVLRKQPTNSRVPPTVCGLASADLSKPISNPSM